MLLQFLIKIFEESVKEAFSRSLKMLFVSIEAWAELKKTRRKKGIQVEDSGALSMLVPLHVQCRRDSTREVYYINRSFSRSEFFSSNFLIIFPPLQHISSFWSESINSQIKTRGSVEKFSMEIACGSSIGRNSYSYSLPDESWRG